MKIVICGSLDFAEKIIDLKLKLEAKGHKVIVPIPYDEDDPKPTAQIRNCILRDFLSDIEKTDAILVANFDHEGVKNYIGPSTFAETVVAFFLEKPIYLLNPIPDLPLKDEVEAMFPVVLNGDFEKISRNK